MIGLVLVLLWLVGFALCWSIAVLIENGNTECGYPKRETGLRLAAIVWPIALAWALFLVFAEVISMICRKRCAR